MDLRNGREMLYEPFLYHPRKELKVTTYTANHTVLKTQTGHVLVMNNAAERTFTLPSVAADDIGMEFTFTTINTGNLVIQAVDSDTIDDSGATGKIESNTDTVASITLRLVSATHWQIVGANGTWNAT